MRYPFYKQLDSMSCGPACLKMISKFYGKSLSLESLVNGSYTSVIGSSLLSLSDMAESIGFRTKGGQITFEKLCSYKGLPCIVQWNLNHFVVVYRVDNECIIVGDPAIGIIEYKKDDFVKYWQYRKNNGVDVGVVLLLEPRPEFYDKKDTFKINNVEFSKLLSYLKPHRKSLLFFGTTILIGALINLIFPVLVQSVVDVGIDNKSIKFVLIILIAQIALTIGSFMNQAVSNWIMLNISSRLSISLIDDFLYKLMRLPISFFDRRNTGDLLQRIGDFERIENFLTTSLITIVMAIISFIPYSFILFGYGKLLLLTFVCGAVLYVTWILFFLKKRRKLDYLQFQEMSRNQNNVIELINGMQEIKLTNCEKNKRREWQKIQVNLFNIRIKGLSLIQMQSSGGILIDQIKNIAISFIAANSVINGTMTLGVMLAIQYIVGQMNTPIFQVVGFIKDTQDTKISMERVNEINLREDEEKNHKNLMMPIIGDICLETVDFHYNGPRSPKIIDNVSLSVKHNSVTAIVGASGSGKTTLMKLMLGFYKPTKGHIKLSDIDLSNYSMAEWRGISGVVMQDGYLFTDTIARNVALSDKDVNIKKVEEACKIACIDKYIDSLPAKYDTLIGPGGKILSIGQKQRILIARAVYGDAPYLFLDEATNSLDANNERMILQNLDRFYKGKTVVIIAHRLSTVKNADNIIVLENGQIVEEGTHCALIGIKGKYYNLIKNQLELGE